jgi:hypothetical protein
MSVKALLCVPLGHRWKPREDSTESYPVLRCERCGRTTALAPGTSLGEGFSARSGRTSRMRGMFDGRIQR